MNAAVVIVTKDRREEAERAVRSALGQQSVSEVLVIDDGSLDGTLDSIAAAFPEARLVRRKESRGYIVRRNEAARLVSAPILVSIDDDAEFVSPDTVARVLPTFDDPRVGAVALPHIDVLQGEQVLQRAPNGDRAYVTNCFRGTAYAIRRDLFLRLGGFRESLYHQAEEQDLCLRMLGEGNLVALAPTAPLVHHASQRRDPLRAWTYGPRNDVLFAWHNVPMPDLVSRLLRITALQLFLGVRVRMPGVFVRSLATGYCQALQRRSSRRPVSRSVYRLYRELELEGPAELMRIANRLPGPAGNRP